MNSSSISGFSGTVGGDSTEFAAAAIFMGLFPGRKVMECRWFPVTYDFSGSRSDMAVKFRAAIFCLNFAIFVCISALLSLRSWVRLSLKAHELKPDIQI